MSIIGFLTSTKDIVLKNGTKIKLKFIDSSGLENFQSLPKTYIKNSEAVLFVFAHDNRTSFYNLSKWIEQLKDINNNMDFSKIIPAYLVGNKCDMEHEIPDEEIEKFKNANKLYGYISTSTKDNIGIDKLLEELGEMLIKIYGKRKNNPKIKIDRKIKKGNKKLCSSCGKADL